jgi:hypothetical protein
MRFSILVCMLMSFVSFGAARAADSSAATQAQQQAASIQIDNDLFSGQQRDRDYSFGIALAFSTPQTNSLLSAVDSLRKNLDELLPRSSAHGSPVLRSTQLGLIAMTPTNLTMSEAQPGDRPYANLMFLTTAQIEVPDRPNRAHYSSLTLGMLGLEIGESLQKGVHRIFGAQEPQGWDHQVSDGGEPTLRFVRAEQWLLGSDDSPGTNDRETKLTLSGSVGFLTEASAAVSMRFGRIRSPWWTFNPELADYISAPLAQPVVTTTNRDEIYAFFGTRLKARAYNALLQGQFRSSDVRVASSDIARFQVEAWAGIASTWSHWRLSYTLRVASSEYSREPAAHPLIWASVNAERAF